MSFLPIVERELRVTSRRGGFYWGRLAAAGTALVLGAILHRSTRGTGALEIGAALFAGLSWLTLAICLLAGAALTADRLSEERREGTLGLLFLTDLRGYDVVLGKLAAAALPALYQLLAVLPLLVLSLLFGGIAMVQVLKVSAALLITLLLSLSVGLAWSVCFTSGTRAMVTVQATLIGLTAGPWLAAWLWMLNRTAPNLTLPLWVEGLLPLSPAFTLILALHPPGVPSSLPGFGFAVSLACQSGLVIFCLVTTSLRVTRAWQDRTATVRNPRWRQRWPAGRASQSSSSRRLEVNPFLWLSLRSRWSLVSVWAGTGLLVTVVLVGHWFYRTEWMDWDLDPLLSILAHGLIKGWAILAAVRQLAEDRRSGTLELLLTTPLTPGDFQRGQFLALGRQLAGPLAIILTADVALCAYQLNTGFAEAKLTILFYGARLVMLGLDVSAIATTGLWLALTKPRSNQAVLGVANRVLWAPWLMILGVLLINGWTGLVEITELRLLGLWFATGVVTDLWLIDRCGRRFERGLREEAARVIPRFAWPRPLFGTR